MVDRLPAGIGIFSRTFDGPSLGAILDKISANGFDLVHFSFRSAGMPALPTGLTPERCREIRGEIEGRGLRVAGVSGTYNAVHPDKERRERETALACALIDCAPALGAPLVSLCTGTRDPEDMWRAHPANDDPAAWSDLRYTLVRLLEAARRADVLLGIEPEHNNVVSSAHRARRLLDEFHDEHLGIILDAANLLSAGTAQRQAAILGKAFDLLGPDIVVIHAKDFTEAGDVAAGRGLLDFGTYFDLVARHGIDAPVVIHEVAEDDVPRARAFVYDQAVRAGLVAAGAADTAHTGGSHA